MKIAFKLSAKLLLAAGLLVSLNARALTLFSPTETRAKAYGDSLWAGVGILSLTSTDANHEARICTAFLIDREWAVTAAHCVITAKPVKLFFEFDQGTGAFEFETEIRQVLRPEEFNQNQSIFPSDWTLLHLKTSVPARYPSYLLATADQIRVGQPALAVGYPSDIGNGDVRMVSSRCSVKALVGDQILSNCDTMRGNSGGPLFVKLANGSYVVAGINSTQYIDADKNILTGRHTYSDTIANHWANASMYADTILETMKEYSK